MGQLKIITNGKEVQDEIIPNSFFINKEIGNRSSTLLFNFKNYDTSIGNDVVLNNDIAVTYRGATIFGGTITNISTGSDGDGHYKSYYVSCQDYSHKLSTILANTRFVDTSLSQIVNELLQQYTGGEYKLKPITNPPKVSVVTLPRIPLTESLDRITELVGYTWYVDETKQVIVARRGTSISNYEITPTSENYITDTFTIREDLTQIRNNVFIRGGDTPAPSRIDTNGNEIASNEYDAIADGTRDVFLPPIIREGVAIDDTGYEFAVRPEVRVNGLVYDNNRMGIDGVSDDSSYNVMWNSAGNHHFIRFTLGNIPVAGTRIKILFTPKIPVLANVKDQTSIARYGQRDYYDRDPTLTSRQDAVDRAQAEVSTYKDPIKRVNFQTYNTNVITGETINIEIPRFDVDSNFLVQSTSIKYYSGSNDDNDIVLVNSITASSIKDIYINDLFISLLTKRDREDGDIADIQNLLNIRDLGVDNLDLSDSDISPTKATLQTNRYVWGITVNRPTPPLVAGFYSKAAYNTSQASTAFVSAPVAIYTPTLTNDAVSSLTLNWGAISNATRYIVKYNSFYGDPLRPIYYGSATTATFTPSTLTDPDLFTNILNGRSNMMLWSFMGDTALTLPTQFYANYVIAPYDLLADVVGAGSIVFSWRPTPSVFTLSYKLQRHKTGTTTNLNEANANWIDIYNGPDITTTATGIPTGTEYTYRLRAEITTTLTGITNKTSEWIGTNIMV